MEEDNKILWFDEEEETPEEITVSFQEYEISATPNDFNLNTIFDFIESGVVKIPGFQRNYVWDKKRASKLIESILINIPIPQIFLYEQSKNNYLVIDGHQRLMTIYYFRKKRFPKSEARAKLRRIFNERGEIPEEILFDDNYFVEFNLDLYDPSTKKKSLLHGLNYSTLGELKTSFDLRTIRNFFIKQMIPPNDDSSIYELFNRLNSGGVNLKPQEIRASLYHSLFYEELNMMNIDSRWRNLLGLEDPDIHMKDIETLLRGFAMLLKSKDYAQSMVRFLNSFSDKAKLLKKEQIDRLRRLFNAFLDSCSELGEFPFTLKTKKFNILMYEAVFVAVCEPYMDKEFDVIPKISMTKLSELKSDKDFIVAAEKETARKINIDKRLERARAILQ